jgi:CRP-like cAMP-binding protein
MDEPQLKALAGVMHRRTFPANTILFRKGDPGGTMFLIVSGKVRIFLHDEHGNDITLRSLGTGQILGEYSTLDRKPRSASVASLAPLETFALERADFLDLLNERPLVGIELMRGFAERIRYATSYLERLYDAVELLSNNDYDQALREIALSADEDEMQEVIAAFLALVRRARAADGEK